MYLPSYFEETRTEELHGLIRAHPLAVLVTRAADGMTADHIPMEVDPAPHPLGTLRGHVARANPVWRQAATDTESLAIFRGPQAYVSPAWYATKRETGKVVPTWNYAVVHAWGRLRFVDDVRWLRALVERLTAVHEAPRPDPWAVSDAPDDWVAVMLRGIVGVEMEITRLAGKWKMSQNRSDADRDGVAAGLERRADPEARAVAARVRGQGR